MRSADPDFQRQLAGYSLATAEITYRLPDARSLLQTFVWQQYDLAPRFPELHKFLKFWERELEGPLYAVKVAGSEILAPARSRHIDHSLALH